MKLNGSHNTHVKPLYGLVLSGGESTRMGTDKGRISYHGRPQREYVYTLLETLCDQIFLSIRQEQVAGVDPSLNKIIDSNAYRGPFNGILTAHMLFPEAAWLVLACDLPLIDLDTLKLLCESRAQEKDATALATHKSGLPEPLAAIWEPQGLQKAIEYLQGAESSCPRKFLIGANTALVFPETDQKLWNANSKEDYEEVQTRLASQ